MLKNDIYITYVRARGAELWPKEIQNLTPRKIPKYPDAKIPKVSRQKVEEKSSTFTYGHKKITTVISVKNYVQWCVSLRSNSSEMSFWLTFCFSDLADLGRHWGVGAPPSEKQKVRQNGASHGRSKHTNEESRRRSFQWCMNHANFCPCFVTLTHFLSHGRIMSTADAVDRAGSRKAATAESSRTKQIERCAADQWKEHEIPRRFMGFLLTFVHYAWRNRLAKFRRRVRAGGRQRATGVRKTTKYNFAKRASQRTNGGSTES